MSDGTQTPDQDIEYTLVLDGEDDGGALIREIERLVPEAETETAAENAADVSDETISIDPVADGSMTGTLVRTQMFDRGQTEAISAGISDTAEAGKAPAETGKTLGLKPEDTDPITSQNAEEPGPEETEIRERIRQRRDEKEAKEKRERVKLWSLIIGFIFLVAMFGVSVTSLFTVDSIEVKGNSYFTGEEIINIGHATPGRNIIYDLNKKSIVDYLEQNPYIKSASVHRKLPSTILIEVEERTQACAFRYDDDYLLMDADGTLLKKTRTEPKLTIISGIVVNKIKLGQKVGAKNTDVFNDLLEIVRAAGRSDLYFVRIDMDEDEDVKAYIYENLSVKSRHKVLIDNLENGRLHKIVEKLFEKGIKRGTITFASDGSASFEPGI